MDSFQALLEALVRAKIDFVLVGGLAAVSHGSAYATYDIDICYSRTDENIRKVAVLLQSLKGKLRGAPEDIPFILDAKSIKTGLNFTFNTRLGDLDILGEVVGLGDYSQVKKYAEPLDLYGLKIFVLTLDGLIRAKQAVHRPKDQMHLKELEAIRAMKKGEK